MAPKDNRCDKMQHQSKTDAERFQAKWHPNDPYEAYECEICGFRHHSWSNHTYRWLILFNLWLQKTPLKPERRQPLLQGLQRDARVGRVGA